MEVPFDGQSRFRLRVERSDRRDVVESFRLSLWGSPTHLRGGRGFGEGKRFQFR